MRSGCVAVSSSTGSALRNALPPVLTVIGLTLAYSLTGTFFVEIVFNWPGLGTFAVHSLLNVDYPAIMGITLFGAAGYVLINLLVDLGPGLARPPRAARPDGARSRLARSAPTPASSARPPAERPAGRRRAHRGRRV